MILLPSRVEARRRARKWTLVSLATLVVVALSSPLWSGPLARLVALQVRASSRHFRVQRVIVRGLHAVPEREILALAQVPCGTTLCDVSTSGVRKRIAAHPWIRFVHVRRRLPDTVEIRVTEREPMAVLRDSEMMMITADSVVVAPLLAGQVWDLPLLTIPHSIKLRAGTTLKDSTALAMLHEMLILRSVSHDAWKNLSEMYFRDGEMHATLASPTVDLVLGQGVSELAWEAALELLRSRPLSLQSMDLRVPGKIIVTESSSSVEEQVHG
jgi:hypothetical protein